MDRLFANAFDAGLAMAGWCIAGMAVCVMSWFALEYIASLARERDAARRAWPAGDSTEPE